MLCCAGPPLPEALRLLAPLANLKVLSLSDNELGGAITADVAVFKKLKALDLSDMNLNGELLGIRTERFNFLSGWFLLTLIKIVSRQAASRKSSRT